MPNFIFIDNIGILYRKHNNLYFKPKDEKPKPIPASNIEAIYILNKVSLTHGAIKLLMNKGIFVHFFYESEKSGVFFYGGSFVPRQKNPSGLIHVKQAQAYLDENRRYEIALEIVDAIRYNMIKVLERFSKVNEELKQLRGFNVKKRYEEILSEEEWKNKRELIMSLESQLWLLFYSALDKILTKFKIGQRTRRPPKNEANAVISFLNSLLYTVTLNEIFKTHLDPTIGFLHELREKRYSLVLDLSEPFKPILTFRTLIWLVNHGVLKENDFSKKFEGILLNKSGREKVVKAFLNKLNTTVKLKSGEKKRFKTLIRMQAYALEKALVEDSKFRAFRLVY